MPVRVRWSAGNPFHSLQATSHALQPMQSVVSVKNPYCLPGTILQPAVNSDSSAIMPGKEDCGLSKARGCTFMASPDRSPYRPCAHDRQAPIDPQCDRSDPCAD